MKTSNCTFREFERLWEENWLNKRDLTPRVKEDYLRIMRAHVMPQLGEKQLSHISSFDIDSLVAGMLQNGYSSKTIKNVFSLVNCTFSYAYKKGFVAENPCDRADDLPAVHQNGDVRFFSTEEAKMFLKALEAESLTFRTFFTMALFGGFRRGELCALKWEDVDFDESCVHIRHAMSRYAGEEHIKKPKTAAGLRCIVLPPQCFELLGKLKKENEKRFAGSMPKDAPQSEFVFQKARSPQPLSLQQATNAFRRILSDNPQLPNIRLHDLRHTSASLLLAYGVDVETVSHRLGHAKPSITLDIYGHALPEIDRIASAKLAQLLKE